MATDQDVAAGLFDWVNSLRDSETINTAEDLSDGAVIWRVLQQIDRLSFPGSLPEDVGTGQWVHRWANLKHVYDALSIFLLEECGQRLPLPGGRPDLKAIAQTASLLDTVLLLKLVVVAAVNCSSRIKYLQKMQTLTESTQEVLMTTVQEAGEDDTAELEAETETPTGLPERNPIFGPALDSDFASEERLGKVIADNQRIAHEKRDLQTQLDDMHDRYVKLQAAHDKAQDELKETNDRLTAVLAGKADVGGSKSFDSDNENVIAALEARILAAEQDSDDLKKSNEVLKMKVEKVKKLQDDFDEMKADRDKLSRRANAAEKYKQKLESTQEIEKENSTLRAKINDLQTQLKQSDSSKVSSSDLLREVDEYRRLLPSIEQERHELNEMKKRLEFDYHTLEARYQDTVEQFAKQQNAMEELQGRLRDFEDGLSPATPKANGTKGLETLGGDFSEIEANLTEALMRDENDPENDISEDELQAIMSAMRSQAQADSATEKNLSVEIEKKLFNAIQRSQQRNKQLQENIQKQTTLINSLQTSSNAKPSSATGTSSPDLETDSPILGAVPPPPESRLHEALALNDNLRRELRLMTSAWYDQNSRLLSGGGVLMSRARATVEPRGFLGKQRKVVNNIMLGTEQ